MAAALARRNRFADQRLRQGHQAAAAESLQHAERGQPFDIRRQRAQHRADHEDRQRHDHHEAAAESVAETTVDRGCDRIGDQIGHHDPGRALDLAEARYDRRQRGGDDGLIGHRHEHRQHDRGEDAEKQRARRGRGDFLIVFSTLCSARLFRTHDVNRPPGGVIHRMLGWNGAGPIIHVGQSTLQGARRQSGSVSKTSSIAENRRFNRKTCGKRCGAGGVPHGKPAWPNHCCRAALHPRRSVQESVSCAGPP